VGLVVFSFDLLERHLIITSIESASLNWSLFILQTAEDVHQELMTVVLLYWIKLLGYKLLQLPGIHNPLMQLEYRFVV
jgi:hypothetical protein